MSRSISARQSLMIDRFNDYSGFEEDHDRLDQSEDIEPCHQCPDCRMGTPLHLKTVSYDLNQMKNEIEFDLNLTTCSHSSSHNCTSPSPSNILIYSNPIELMPTLIDKYSSRNSLADSAISSMSSSTPFKHTTL